MTTEKKAYVTILGCGDAFASGGRFNTCFYINDHEHHFLVDCGASALVSIKRYGVPASQIQYIILSHLHGDHFGGIPSFLLDAQYNQERSVPLTIVGPPETEQRVKALTGMLYPGISLDDFNFKVIFQEYEPEKELHLPPLTITAIPVVHSKPTNPHGLRIRFRDKIFAFSGDTEWTEALVEISKKADLFICESNFYNKKAPNHLDYHTIMIHKDRFSCKKLLLNHLGEEMISKADSLELDCAIDGQVLEL